MSASKPILAMMNGEGPRIVTEAQCGKCVPAADAEGLAKVLKEMSQMDKAELVEMGRRGKIYQQSRFDLDQSIRNLIDIWA